MDVREHAARRDRHAAEQLVELLVVAHRELDVARDDARLLVVARRVARELEDLGAEVLEDRREVDWGATADARRVAALLEVAADAATGNWRPALTDLETDLPVAPLPLPRPPLPLPDMMLWCVLCLRKMRLLDEENAVC